MKKNIFKLLICVSVFISCDKDETDTDVQASDSNFTIMTNIDDPLLTIYEEDDVKTYYYGDRDDNGVPLGIDLVEIVRQDDTTLLTFNETGKLEQIFTQNGVQISLDWLSDSSASVVMISPNGEQQINFIVDPSNVAAKSTSKHSKSSRLNRKVIRNNTSKTKKTVAFNKTVSNFNGNVNINVSSCFEPTDAPRVDLIVESDDTGLWKGRFPAERGANVGEYYTTIPTSTATEIELKEDICIPLADAFNFTCDVAQNTLFLDALCISLSAAIATSGIGAPIAAPFYAACETTVLELRLFCPFNKLGGSTSLATKLCDSPEFNRTFTESLKIYAVASGAVLNSEGGSTITSATEVVAGKGPYPNLTIELGSETAISPVTISPSVPSDGQDYTVSIDLLCVYQNTKVEFTVVGTDGFTATESFFSNTNSLQPFKSELFSFVVPGAEIGVRDNITVKITLPDGTSTTRKASLVFG